MIDGQSAQMDRLADRDSQHSASTDLQAVAGVNDALAVAEHEDVAAHVVKILIVGPSWVGDMMMAQSLFIALKRENPARVIDVLAPAWSLPLLKRMPEVADAIAMPLGHGEFGLAKRFRLGRDLRSRAYDQAYILPNSWKSALIPFFAGIPKRIGFIGECRWGLLNDARKLEKSLLTMTVQRFVALATPKQTPAVPEYANPHLPINPDGQRAVTEKFGLKLTQKVLVMCPGAEFGPSKRWPAGHFAQVAQAKIEQGWQVWLLGSEKEADAAMEIMRLTAQQCLDFIGRTTLTEAVDLISLADAVVVNDSGLMHLAAALDRKLIAVFGSTPTELTPPLSVNAHIVTLNLPCSPCRKRICPLYPVGHPDHNQCLTGITPQRVLNLLEA